MSGNVNWHELSLQLTMTFAHFLWQACVVAVALIVVEWSISTFAAQSRKRNSARRGADVPYFRYVLCCLAFAALPICVCTTFALVHASRPPIRIAAAKTAEIAVISSSRVETLPMAGDSEVIPPPPVALPEVLPPPTTDRDFASAASVPAVSWSNRLEWFSPYFLIGYVMGVSMLLARFGLALFASGRLRCESERVTDLPLLQTISEHSERMGLTRVPLIVLCQRVSVPAVIGIIKPTILLPPALLCGLDLNQLAGILSHEMAHIRRYDLLIKLLQRIVEALLFFHPVTWWISHRMNVERENCCDDLAVAGCGRLQYAGALLRMAELCATARGMKIAPQLEALAADGGSTSQLSQRIHRLLGEVETPRLAVTRTSIAVAAASFSLSVMAFAQNNAQRPNDEASSPKNNITENEQIADSDDSDGIAANALSVIVIDKKTGEPISRAYLTLWRELLPSEAEPKNTVNGPTGFGYYNPVIWDDAENDARWVRARSAHPNDGRHGRDEERFQFNSLKSGRYRVTAVPYRPNESVPDPTPCGVSDPFRTDGNQPTSIEVRLTSGDANMTVKLVDAESKKAISRIAIRLRDAHNTPIVHGHGNGNFFERTDKDGSVRFGSLPPGRYSVQVLGKQARVNDFVEYSPLGQWIQLEAKSGESTIEIAVPPRPLPEAEIAKRYPFSAFGRVTDGDGKPLADITIRVATGVGTLLGGGTAKTNAGGHYRLYFGPGMHMRRSEYAPRGVGVQAAHFYVASTRWKLVGEKDGYHSMLMTDQTDEQLAARIKRESQVWGHKDTAAVVFADQPRELNFILKPVVKEVQRTATSTRSEIEPKYPNCVVDVENVGPRSLAAAIEAFNMRSMESPIGRFEVPVTEAETLEAIRSFRRQPHLPDSVKGMLQEIANTKRIPATAYFRRFTRYDDGQQMNRVWWVRLVITSDDPPVYSVPIRTKTLMSRSYTQMERQQNAENGVALINRFSTFFEVPPNILLLVEFPQAAKDRLIADVRAAITGDAAAIERTFNWKGVGESTRRFAIAELNPLRDASVESIGVRARNFKGKLVHWSAFQHYEPNLPIVGYLDIKYRAAGDDKSPIKTLSLEMGSTGEDLRLVNYIKHGKLKLPKGRIQGLSSSGQIEPLADGTYLTTTITTNPDNLLSAHLSNEEVWKRAPNFR